MQKYKGFMNLEFCEIFSRYCEHPKVLLCCDFLSCHNTLIFQYYTLCFNNSGKILSHQ